MKLLTRSQFESVYYFFHNQISGILKVTVRDSIFRIKDRMINIDTGVSAKIAKFSIICNNFEFIGEDVEEFLSNNYYNKVFRGLGKYTRKAK